MYQILWGIQCGQEDNGDVFSFLVLFQNHSSIKTADIGHHHIKQNQIRMLLLSLLYTCSTIVSGTYLKFFVSQQYLQKQDITNNVINNKYFILTAVYFGFKCICYVHACGK